MRTAQRGFVLDLDLDRDLLAGRERGELSAARREFRADDAPVIGPERRLAGAVQRLLPFDRRAGAARLLLLGPHVAQVELRHLVRRTGSLDVAVLQVDGVIAERLHHVHAVRHEQQRHPCLGELLQPLQAFELERRVAHGERLVDDQHVGVDVDRHREGEPQLHPARIRLGRLLDEGADVGKRRDVVEPLLHLRARDAHDRAVHEHVLAPGEIRVESGTELEQRSDASGELDVTGRRRERARDELQQRGLARAVAPDDSHRFAFAHLERHVAQGPELAEELTPAAIQHLLQPIAGLVVDLVALAQVLGANGDVRGHRQTPCACAGTRTGPARPPRRSRRSRPATHPSPAAFPRSGRRATAR